MKTERPHRAQAAQGAAKVAQRAQRYVQMFEHLARCDPSSVPGLKLEAPLLAHLTHVLRTTAIVELWALADISPPTPGCSIPTIAQELENAEDLPHGRTADICSAIKGCPAYAKVRKLRHNAFAHRSRNESFDEVFKTARLHIDELNALAILLLDLANELSTATGGYPMGSVSAEAKGDAERLLKRLSIHGSPAVHP
jgi:hypothetical protein